LDFSLVYSLDYSAIPRAAVVDGGQMWDGAWSFARRHQRKLLIGAGVVGGLYYSGRLLVQRLVEMQGVAARERTAKEGIRRRFDQNQRDCMFTIMSLLPELSEQVLREVDVERLIAELRALNKPQSPDPLPAEQADGPHVAECGDGEGADANGPPRRTKVQIWEDIKIQSFARTLIAVYAESLLTMLVHVQLNMVGRTTYLDSVVGRYAGAAAAGERAVPEGPQCEPQLAPADEQNFLMLSWWLLNRGWRLLMAQIVRATNHCVGQLPLKERLSHRELASLFGDIHIRLREDGLVQMLPEIILPLGDACVDDYLASNRLAASRVFTPAFVRLLDQMRDVIESPDFLYVFNSCVDRLTAQLLEVLQESFPEPVPPPAPCGPLPPTVEGEAAPNLDEV
ncbi:peroxin, partial [Coemansia biformis]